MDNIDVSRNKMWVSNQGGKYFQVVDELKVEKPKSGFYRLIYEQGMNTYFLKKINLVSKNLIRLKYPQYDKMLGYFNVFMEKRGYFEELNIRSCLNMLLYGKTGNGKTSLMNLIAKEIIEKHDNVICMEIKSYADFEYFMDFSSREDDCMSGFHWLLIFDEIDSYSHGATYQREEMLKFMRGFNPTINMIILATTNNIDSFDESMKSRFDYLVEIENPDEVIKHDYLRSKDIDHKIDMELFNKESIGWNISDIDVFLKSHFILDMPVKEAYEKINNKKGKIYGKDSKPMGFGS